MRWLLTVSIFLMACSSEHETLVKKAEQEAVAQKSQLAKYLFAQIVEHRKLKDDIRYRALKGLANVCSHQIFDYPCATHALETLFDEFGQVQRYKEEISHLRVEASEIWRLNLQRSEKALDVMSPLLNESFRADIGYELGLVYGSLKDFKNAEHWLLQTWEDSKRRKDCTLSKKIQLDLIQLYSVHDVCDKALTWTGPNLYEGCVSHDLSLSVEKAHCLEMTGNVTQAMEIYQKMLEINPKNARAHFFLEGIKKRQRESQLK